MFNIIYNYDVWYVVKSMFEIKKIYVVNLYI